MGDSTKSLQWISKSLRKIVSLAKALCFDISQRLEGELLKAMGYSLQSHRKTNVGST